MYSGSEAEASQRLLRMKMFGLESRSLTLWKKDFSWKKKRESFQCARKKNVEFVTTANQEHRPEQSASTNKLTACMHFITSHRLHQCGFRVCYQDKDISIQAELVDPTVQFRGHVNPWAARQSVENISSQRRSHPRMSECRTSKHARKKLNAIRWKTLRLHFQLCSPSDTSWWSRHNSR